VAWQTLYDMRQLIRLPAYPGSQNYWTESASARGSALRPGASAAGATHTPRLILRGNWRSISVFALPRCSIAFRRRWLTHASRCTGLSRLNGTGLRRAVDASRIRSCRARTSMAWISLPAGGGCSQPPCPAPSARCYCGEEFLLGEKASQLTTRPHVSALTSSDVASTMGI